MGLVLRSQIVGIAHVSDFLAQAISHSMGTTLVASGTRSSMLAAITRSGSPVARAAAVSAAEIGRRVSYLGLPPSPPYAYCTIRDPHRTVPSDATMQSFIRWAIRRCL